ncbi:hypothetical protein H6G33_32795 [Calothrix sp. FACHB-1219]|uniref:hypothetical protein n=1 Tax=unclassified Calothrix TaxID=2619626 RepID=UPI0016837D53|nr:MULTISPECIES: hypothetical protein [unclassified Calothrix]MBD2202633.1 hypothetical protein [Calothrix sp. FACHB-168]MBD2221737.1 hypothetical protein [Calothrix sp. FACHB-1219]
MPCSVLWHILVIRSTVNSQQSTVNRQPSTVNRQPSTVNSPHNGLCNLKAD